MIQQYLNDNRAQNFRRWLNTIDLSSADILGTESAIYEALLKSRRRTRWAYWPIADLAEPVDLDALVGDLLTGSYQEIRFQAHRLDNLFSWISDTNNLLKADLETIEGLVVQATDDMREMSLVTIDETQDFFWISDTFNSTTFIDLNNSNALVDVDYGQVSLSPQTVETVRGWDVVVDTQETVGLPGVNMLVLNLKPEGEEGEPIPTFENSATANIANILDGDPSTWFEVERNFVRPRQRVIQLGRAYVASSSGEEQSVREITKDLDWEVIVQWPDQPKSIEGNRVLLAEFKNLDTGTADIAPLVRQSRSTFTQGQSESERTFDISQSPISKNNEKTDNVRLVFEIRLSSPQPFSLIKLLPFIREGQQLVLKNIQVFADGVWFDIINDVIVGSNTSNSVITQQIGRRTGAQTSGVLYSVPSDRDIEKIRVTLESAPIPVDQGLAHPFREVYEKIRREKRFFGARSVRKRYRWRRVPATQGPRFLKSEKESGNPFGSIAPFVEATLGLAAAVRSLNTAGQPRGPGGTAGQVGGLLEGLGEGLKNLGGKGLASAGAFLGNLGAIGVGVGLIGDVAKTLFGSKKTITVEDERSGWDVFSGWRASIGIRDLQLLKVVYQEESVLQTRKLTFNGPVSMIGLFTEESVPEGWGPGDWVSYFISTDGNTFVPIQTLKSVTLDKSYRPSTPVTNVWIRIILRGNPEDPFRSPLVKHITLQGLPA